MHALFYLPYLYTRKTRLEKKGRLLSYFLILALPSAYFAVVLQSEITLQNILYTLLGLIYIQNLYEIGYIQNDTETIKKETDPTLRLSKGTRHYYEQNKLGIYGIRAFIALGIGLILLCISDFNPGIQLFLFVSSLICPIFLIYNQIRTVWILALHFLLTILKYSSLQLLFFDTLRSDIFLLSIFIFPVINLLERAATQRFFKRYSAFFRPKIVLCRIGYYFSLLLVYSILWYLHHINLAAWILVAFYFVYRSAIFITKKK
jgi:hypothetical protein